MFGCYVAGARETAAISARSVYTIHYGATMRHVTSLQA